MCVCVYWGTQGIKEVLSNPWPHSGTCFTITTQLGCGCAPSL